MANETYLPIRGRLTGDPELRYTPSGTAVAGFTVATNARKFNRQTNEWENKPAKFWRCVAWNQGKLTLAENICEALKKGDSVILYGEMETRKYTTKEGEERTVDEIRVESIGKDLTFHKPTQHAPAASTHEPGPGWGAPQQQQQQGGGWNAPANDPWSSGSQPPNGGGNTGGWN